MTRIFALLVTVMAIAMAALAADESPGEQPDSFDIEPPILKENLSEEPLLSTAAPDGGVGRLEKQLERAKRNAAGAEHLWKIGVLAKVEVEQRALKVVRLESDLANAQLARAKNDLAAQEKRERAELDAAEANLRRQEKLLRLGSAHKSDVNQAQEKLAELKAEKN